MPDPSANQTNASTPLLSHGANGAHPSQSTDTSGNGASPPTPPGRLRKADTDLSWPDPVGLSPRGANDENLFMFRRALGINSTFHQPKPDQPSSGRDSGCELALEEGRRSATGIYAQVMYEQRMKQRQYLALLGIIYGCHLLQVVVGAAVTVLGPSAQEHKTAITTLGAGNSMVAGLLALVTRQGLAEKLHKDEVAFRQLRSWIEETESLLSLGVVGRDRIEVGVLVETAYKKFNAAQRREEMYQLDDFSARGNSVTTDGVQAYRALQTSSGRITSTV